MSKEIERSSAAQRFDFSKSSQIDLDNIDVKKFDQVVVDIPLSSLGSSNSHIDLCSDLVDALWTLETLAVSAGSIEATVGSGYFKPKITAVLGDLQPTVRAVLADCALLFTQDDVEPSQRDRLGEIRSQIEKFEDTLHTYAPRFPDIADWYFANLMIANYEWRSEAPEYYKEQMAMFPERRVGFFRSAHSERLGDNCYASNEGWVLPGEVQIDIFFEVTNQRYRLGEFIEGEVLAFGGQPIVVAEGLVANFPVQQFLRSQICAGFAASKPCDDWHTGPFDWLDGPFLPFPVTAETLRSNHVGAGGFTRQKFPCLTHPTGTLIILSDNSFRYLLYDTFPLNLLAVKRLYEHAAATASRLLTAAGISASLTCDWASLSDEDFEQLCYDLIFLNPKYDAETIRKLGKSRSRDGGRDIEIFESIRWPRKKPKKWIFQCKLIKNNKSLGVSKVQDVGDMLEQCGAQGFGVLTSTFIDATLYDKLDNICCRRGIEQNHMSVLELERALSRHPVIRNRFFPAR